MAKPLKGLAFSMFAPLTSSTDSQRIPGGHWPHHLFSLA
jgi:hypothetical protein